MNYIVAVLLLFPLVCSAEVLFEADFEGDGSGDIPWLKGGSAHPGGGYINFLGGEISNGTVNPGDGTKDYRTYNNVVLDSSSPARNSILGSNYALKTHYAAGHERSFQRNTTVIKFPEKDEVYIRWYQKWSENWIFPVDQQKLSKIKGPGSSQNVGMHFGRNHLNLTKQSYPKTILNETYVFSEWEGAESGYRKRDTNPATKNTSLIPGEWYCIEVHVKSNSKNIDGSDNMDAEFHVWLDDQLTLEYTGTHNRIGKTGGIDQVQLQHVYQSNAALTEGTPTYMDNIVVSTERIGCEGKLVPDSSDSSDSSPSPPARININ